MKKSKNKILTIISIFLFVVFFGTTNIYATENEAKKESVLNIDIKEDVYKTSESTLDKLPYIIFSTDRIIMDKDDNKLGLLFSAKDIEVNNKQEAVQILLSNGAVRINAPVENVFGFAVENFVINNNIQKSAFILSSNKITIAKDAVVSGDLVCYAPEIVIEGKVEGNVIGTANNVVVNGEVGGDLRVQTQNITTSSDNNIKGKLVIDTYNKDLKIKETYKNAIVNFLEQKETKSLFTIVLDCVIYSLILVLIYLIVKRFSKKDFFDNLYEKTKNNFGKVVLVGSLSLLVIPLVFLVYFLLSTFLDAANVLVGYVIVYLFYIIICSLLSTFVIAIILNKYINTKYLKKYNNTNYSEVVSLFFIFVSLYILARLPVVGVYITMLLIILSVGTISTYLFKKGKNTKN